MQNKNCSFYRQQIFDYFSDLLGEEEISALMKHIQSCPHCRSEFEELQAILDAASALPEEEVPDGLKEAVYSKLADITPTKVAIPHRWRRLVSVAVPLVACAVLAIGIYQGGLYEKFVGSDNIISVAPETNEYTTDSATETTDTETTAAPAKAASVDNTSAADTAAPTKAVVPTEKTSPAAEETFDKSDSGKNTTPITSGSGGSSAAAPVEETDANAPAPFAQENSPELAEQPLQVNAGRMAVPAFEEAEEDISIASSTEEESAIEESLPPIPVTCTVTAGDISAFTKDTLSEETDKIYISVSAEEWENFKSFALSQGASLSFTYSEEPVDFVSVTIRKR